MTHNKAAAHRLIVQAESIILERKGTGVWSGSVHAHTDYQTRPVEWIIEFLNVPERTLRWSMNKGYGKHKWDGDRDPIIKMLETLGAGKDCGVESATGTGKTFIAACIVLWFLACFEDAIVVTAAPKKDQLLLHVWKEIGNLWPQFEKHFPQAELLTGKIRMRPTESGKEKWTATAFVAGVGADEDVATKAAGFHAEHMLWITEETPGMHPAIMNTIEHTRTDDHNLHLALGNPDHRQDELHRFCEQDWVVAIRISALDHPNIVSGERIVPGAIGRRRLQNRIKSYGGPGARFYLSRIRGVSPAESEDALIKWDWCIAAAERYKDPELRIGAQALGVDVANSEDGDKGAISRWQGACCTEVEDFKCPDGNLLGRRIVLEARDAGIDPRHVGVDSVGVGAGCVNEAKRMGFKVRQISSATKAIPRLDTDLMWTETYEDDTGRVEATGPRVIEAERFGNLRDQVWWWMREDLRKGTIALPDDRELFLDLTTPTYGTEGGIIRVQKKEESYKLLKRSPNKGDACCYGNWVRRRRPAPLQKEEDPVFVDTADRDYGLERMVARHKKLRRDEDREWRRRWKKIGRMKKRAGL